jgi:ketosteroid isomerase-like protein
MNDGDRSLESLFDRFSKAFVRCDEDELSEVLSEDFVWNMPTGEVHRGHAAVIGAIRARQASADRPRFSDSRFEIHGDTAVQNYRVEVTAPNGQKKVLNGCDVYKVENGRIVSKDAYWKQIV